jgi:hypothetical protein
MVANDGTESWGSYAEACTAPESSPCNCISSSGYAYYDYDKAQKVTLSATEIANMDKVERISMVSGTQAGDVFTPGGTVTGDMFMIRKPLIVNSFNASTYIPSIGMSAANYCENVTSSTSLNLSVGAGFISYANVHHSYSRMEGGMSVWDYEGAEEDYWDDPAPSKTFAPIFSKLEATDQINYSHLYISAHDEFERQFVRHISCEQ